MCLSTRLSVTLCLILQYFYINIYHFITNFLSNNLITKISYYILLEIQGNNIRFKATIPLLTWFVTVSDYCYEVKDCGFPDISVTYGG